MEIYVLLIAGLLIGFCVYYDSMCIAPVLVSALVLVLLVLAYCYHSAPASPNPSHAPSFSACRNRPEAHTGQPHNTPGFCSQRSSAEIDEVKKIVKEQIIDEYNRHQQFGVLVLSGENELSDIGRTELSPDYDQQETDEEELIYPAEVEDYDNFVLARYKKTLK